MLEIAQKIESVNGPSSLLPLSAESRCLIFLHKHRLNKQTSNIWTDDRLLGDSAFPRGGICLQGFGLTVKALFWQPNSLRLRLQWNFVLYIQGDFSFPAFPRILKKRRVVKCYKFIIINKKKHVHVSINDDVKNKKPVIENIPFMSKC